LLSCPVDSEIVRDIVRQRPYFAIYRVPFIYSPPSEQAEYCVTTRGTETRLNAMNLNTFPGLGEDFQNSDLRSKLPLNGAKKVKIPKKRPDGTHAENLWVQDAVSPSIVYPKKNPPSGPPVTLDDIVGLDVGQRVPRLSSPRSIKACLEMGVDPVDLEMPVVDDFHDEKVDAAIWLLKYDHALKRREQILSQLQTMRENYLTEDVLEEYRPSIGALAKTELNDAKISGSMQMAYGSKTSFDEHQRRLERVLERNYLSEIQSIKENERKYVPQYKEEMERELRKTRARHAALQQRNQKEEQWRNKTRDILDWQQARIDAKKMAQDEDDKRWEHMMQERKEHFENTKRVLSDAYQNKINRARAIANDRLNTRIRGILDREEKRTSKMRVVEEERERRASQDRFQMRQKEEDRIRAYECAMQTQKNREERFQAEYESSMRLSEEVRAANEFHRQMRLTERKLIFEDRKMKSEMKQNQDALYRFKLKQKIDRETAKVQFIKRLKEDLKSKAVKSNVAQAFKKEQQREQAQKMLHASYRHEATPQSFTKGSKVYGRHGTARRESTRSSLLAENTSPNAFYERGITKSSE